MVKKLDKKPKRKTSKASVESKETASDLNNLDESQSEQEEPTTQNSKLTRHKRAEKNIEALEVGEKNTAVIYIGHLPWGFDDTGIQKYFEQFGKITRIIVPRSKKVTT